MLLSSLTGSAVIPDIIPPSRHAISRDSISTNALKVLDRLHQSGFASYLVGGGVRDALLSHNPKDFDIATDASPEEVRSLFRNSRIIGRRFRLVHVVFGRDIIEVATFRADHSQGSGGETGKDGRILRDNVFGSIEEDARRRDFSVNALYYNIDDNTVVDFVDGMEDLQLGVFRLIGDPVQRCEEDPVRVLRAARLSAKLDFSLDPATLSAMQSTAPMLSSMPPARLFEEALKMFQGGYAVKSFEKLLALDLFKYLFPATALRLQQTQTDQDDSASEQAMITSALMNTDSRVQNGLPVTPAYLLAFLLWRGIYTYAQQRLAEGASPSDALWHAGEELLPVQQRITAIPRRFSAPMREIWSFQPKLEQYSGNRALGLMESRRFRAAYDFLCLRAQFDERLSECAGWWTEVQELNSQEQEEFVSDKPVVNAVWGESPRKKRRGRKGGKGRRGGAKKSNRNNHSNPSNS